MLVRSGYHSVVYAFLFRFISDDSDDEQDSYGTYVIDELDST